MHIYCGNIYPPKLTINLCNINTPNNYHIWHNAHIVRIQIPPTPIENRCMG